jgi:hypothetical protein
MNIHGITKQEEENDDERNFSKRVTLHFFAVLYVKLLTSYK